MVAIPYCFKCNMKVDPKKDRCPNCGGPVRFKFIRGEQEPVGSGKEERKPVGEYIRPRSNK